jgi:hypothetical protein
MKTVTSATDFFIKFRGKEFKDNGKLICKAAAWELYRLNRWQAKGHRVTFTDKPGWVDGKLVKSREYDRYFEQLTF